MWAAERNRLALLELWESGRLLRRAAQEEAAEELLRLGWARRTRRGDVLQANERHRADVAAALGRVWPGWEEVLAALRGRGLPPTERGLRGLLAAQREEALPALPGRLNLRTATAAVAAHSKAALGHGQRGLLRDVELTRDGVVRMRGAAGLLLVRGGSFGYRGEELEALLGEVVLTERAMRDGTRLVGRPRALLLVENAGPFVDLPAPLCIQPDA
jgi:hypothetical protein